MDYLIETVGDYGKFQYKATLIVGLISALSSACIYATIFIAAEPDFICKKKINLGFNLTEETNLSYDEKCKIWSSYYVNQTSDYECYFDKSLYDKTIINEWNLICDRQYRASLTQTIHIFGSLFGFCGGVLGDKYGRRRSVLIFSFLLTFSLLFSQFLLLDFLNLNIEIKYYIYSISQFLIGLLVNCLYCTAYVLLMEFTTEKHRTKIANLNSYIYLIGELIVLVVYYLSRDWHILNWFVGLYSLLIFMFSFALYESPSWLISIDRNDDAIKILKKIAKINGKKNYHVPMSLIETLKLQEKLIDNEYNESILSSAKINDQNGNGINSNGIDHKLETKNECSFDIFMLKEIFRPKKMFIKTCLLFYIWTALMLLYYGISLGVTSVDLVDPYLMYFLSCIAELIGYIFCYLNDIFGRKKTMFGFFIVTTIMYSLIAYFSANVSEYENSSFSFKAILLMTFALLGKCAVSGAYHIAYIFTSELYPTATRNTAVLFLTCFGGLSSLIAPQINTLKTLVWNPMPYIIYSICSLLSCVCVMYLPETHKMNPKK